jgi:hypothetical protein
MLIRINNNSGTWNTIQIQESKMATTKGIFCVLLKLEKP